MIACVCLQANEPAVPTTRNQDLRVILEKTSFSPKMDPYFNALIAEAVAKTKKTVDSQEIMQKLRNSITEDAIVTRLTASYSKFSDQEIHELRCIYENPTFLKYCDHLTGEGMLSDIMVMRELCYQLVDEQGTTKQASQVTSSAKILEITPENFEQEIAHSTKPLIVDVYSTTCPPCRAMEPIVEELSQEYQDTVRFVKINCETQSALARHYGVTSLPTLLFIKPGEEKASMKKVGFTNKADLEARIVQFLQEAKK